MCSQCYLYADEPRPSDTQLGTDSASASADGTTIATHRSDRVCFPMIPFISTEWPSFRQLTNTEGIDYDELTYTNSCKTDTVLMGMDALKQAGVDFADPWAPVALVLRSAEAVDALRNLAATGSAPTGAEAAGALICGVMQLGGILYLALLLPALSLVLICAAPLTAWCLCCARCCLGLTNPQGGRQARTGTVIQARKPFKARRGAAPSRQDSRMFTLPAYGDGPAAATPENEPLMA